MADQQSQGNPKPKQPEKARLEKIIFKARGKEGKYVLEVWTLDQKGGFFSNIIIRTFKKGSTVPLNSFASKDNGDPVTFSFDFSEPKLTVVIAAGHLEERVELEGPKSSKKRIPEADYKNLSPWEIVKKAFKRAEEKRRKK